MKIKYLSIATTSVALGLAAPMGYAMEEKLSESTEFSPPITSVSISTAQPQTTFRSVDQILSPLLVDTKSSYWHDQTYIKKSLNLISEMEREKIAPSIVALFKDSNYYWEIFEALNLIPENERVSIVEMALYIRKDSCRYGIKKTLKVLNKMHPTERMKIIKMALPFCKARDAYYRDEMLETLWLTPPDERESIIEMTQTFFKDLEEIDYNYIFKGLNIFPINERLNILNIALPLMKNQKQYMRMCVLEVLNLIPADEHKRFSEIALPLFEDKSMGGWLFPPAFKKIPNNERMSILEMTLALCKDQSAYTIADMLEALNLVSANERLKFGEIILPFIRTHFREAPKILNCIPANERVSFAETIMPLFEGMKGREREDILKALEEVQASKEENIVDIILLLLKNQTPCSSTHILKTLNGISTNERLKFVEIILPLIKDFNEYDTYMIIEALAMIPGNERVNSTFILTDIKEKDNSSLNKAIYTLLPNHIYALLLTTDLSIKEATINHWSEIISSRDKYKAKEVSELIARNIKEFGLNNFDPIVQQAKTYLSFAR